MSFEKCTYSLDPVLNFVNELPFAWAPGTREIIDEWRAKILRRLAFEGGRLACYRMKHYGKPNPVAAAQALKELENEALVVFETDTVRLA